MEAITEIIDLPLNPSSVHSHGRNARKILEESRSKIKQKLGIGDDYDLIFTSSCTEANNLALNNFPELTKICSTIEHPSVLNLIGEGLLPVDENGVLNLDYLEDYLNSHSNGKLLISVMYANNEVGTIQPVARIKELARRHGHLFHCDITQAIGRIDVDVRDVDLITLSSHKFGGPVGSGALIYKKRLKLKPMMLGGGQEFRMRSGTQNILAIHGMATAFNLLDEIKAQYKQITKLRDYLERELISASNEVIVFGSMADRLPNTSSLSMPNVSAETQLIYFDLNGISLSAGSACSSGRIDIPKIHMSMGVSEEVAKTAIRISLGPDNNLQEVNEFISLWLELCRIHLSVPKRSL
jgi:cysteine desulfurase